jgi:type II secretory pathway component PulK
MTERATKSPRQRAAACGSALRCAPTHRRRGAILIVAILVTMTLAGMVLVLCRRMSVEAIASANDAAAIQAAAVERGGEQYVLGILSDTTESPLSLGEENFQAVQVGDGWFWVLRPDYDDPDLPLYGVVDECSKLDINSASYESLMRLPGMTDEFASAIVDWRDEDDTISPGGAENEYYLSLPNPYYCKNGPFETVEELLLVRGATPQLLYGDGTAPPIGSTPLSRAASGTGTILSDPQVARGLYDLLTVYSSQPNTAADGTRRVNLNDRNALRTLMQQRLNGGRANEIIGLLGRGRLADVFDLYFRGRMTADELDQIADYVTTSQNARVSGRVNINTAPRDVLLAMEELDPGDVDKLISQRNSVGNADSGSIAWVADALGEKAVGLGNRITGRSTRYSADILAVSGNGRAFKRVRIVVDIGSATSSSSSLGSIGSSNTSGATPRIIYRRDLSDRGWPMDPQILASIRAGQMQQGGGMNNPLAGGLGR